VPRSRFAPTCLVVVHTGVVSVPPIGTVGNHGLIPQPRTSSIPVAAIIAGPPSHTYADEAVIEAMVVIGKVIVIVAVPVLAMPIVAVPIIPVPCGAAMPATTAPTANTGDATYSASADMAATDVAPAKTCSAAHVTTTHVTTTHVTTTMASGIRLTQQDRNKQQTACKSGDCGYMLFLDCISLGTQTRRPARRF
jgi:hypothetical protein